MSDEPHPDLLRVVKSDDFLPPIGFWTNFGSLSLVVALTTTFVLAAFIKYNVTIKATATVRPSGGLRIVQASQVIKARIAINDIGKVKVCRTQKVLDCKQGKVILRFSAYPYPEYGTLTGAVRTINVDTTQSSTNAPYYEVTIEPDKQYLEKGGVSYPIQPGMEVTADIISTQQTILTFILTKARLISNL